MRLCGGLAPIFLFTPATIFTPTARSKNSPRPRKEKCWHNIVTPEVSKVAETLGEFRGAYKYNLLDENVRRFNAEVPQLWQWDDHEVTNNWSSSKDLASNPAYAEKNVPLLVGRATRAFHEYAPLRRAGDEEQERVY